MTTLWPQLPESAANQLYESLGPTATPTPATEHPAQLWSPVGGRVKSTDMTALSEELTGLAEEYGYPAAAGDSARISFDRAAAQVLRKRLDLDWSEAGKRGVWSFVALVLLPHLTLWRFGIANRERWVASDLTRHTWARLWWQAVVFAGHETLLDALTESDLNQILERRSIGGDSRLTCALAEAVIAAPDRVPRRHVIRQSALRLRRWLAFLDVAALDDAQLRQVSARAVEETVANYRSAP